MTDCDALSVAAAAALSPAAIAFLTCFTAVRNDERRLALCLFLTVACRARLRAWALFAMRIFLRNLEEQKKTKHNSTLRQFAQTRARA
jgi:hypothetical protein